MSFWLIAAIGFLALHLLAVRTFRSGRRHKRNIRTANTVIRRVSSIASPAARLTYLRKIDPYVFEELLMTAFQRQGWRIIRNQRYSGDGGFDGRVEIDGVWHLVQAKRYSGPIRREHYRDLVELCQTKGMPGIFVHTGRTPRFERCELVDLVSGQTLLDLIGTDNE